MRTILLACVMSALAFPTCAQQPPKPPEPKTTTIYAPPGGVAMTILWPVHKEGEEIVIALTGNPAVTTHKLSSSALLVALGAPGCANVKISTISDDVKHRFCFEESTAPGVAEGAIVVRKAAVCLMAGIPRETCESHAPENFKRTAEGTATTVRPDVTTGRVD